MKTITKPVPPEFKLGPNARVVPKDQRHQMRPEAFEDRNTKVRVSIYLDLDVLDYFKGLAGKPGALPYQTQINAALREIAEKSDTADVVSSLRQMKTLVDTMLRQVS